MGLLAPLYIAGALAVALPILFHLIRRTPSGKQRFSSLMFLTFSPPRLTRRSRLNNILLLILRALAVILLALAFARPFFHQGAELEMFKTSGRRIALLVDTSASMRRADLWQQALKQVDDVLKDISPNDEVALYLFDRVARPAFTFAEWRETDPSTRVVLLRRRLDAVQPAWAGTRIGDSLATVADLLGETDGVIKDTDNTVRQVILISDLQQGGRIDALQGHQWPKSVMLQVKTVAPSPKLTTNASIQWIKQTTDDAPASPAADAPSSVSPASPAPAIEKQKLKIENSSNQLRVRVSNQPNSTRDQFTLTFANAAGPIPGIEPVKAYVPPGRSLVVRVPWPKDISDPKQEPDRLVLNGDDADFDNTLYVVPPRTESLRLAWIGDDAPDDPKGLRYYFQNVVGDTEQRKTDWVTRPANEPVTDANLAGTRLVVVSTGVSDESAVLLRKFIEDGGDLLWVLKNTDSTKGLSPLMNLPQTTPQSSQLSAQEAAVRQGDYALLSRVDFAHPLFVPFADTRFSDFTKIHFWHYRKVKVPDQPGLRVVAWFDTGDPFLIEQTIGKGRFWIMTSGWHYDDSQMALSTKFVPLIDGMLQRRDQAVVEAQYSLNDPIALPPIAGADQTRSLTTPGSRRIELPQGLAATSADATDQPGIYRLNLGGKEIPLAVNLPADESRTAPVVLEELEHWGAQLGTKSTSAEAVAQERRLKTEQLENRQKIWRWLLVFVLGLLAAETALAGRIARHGLTEKVTA